MPFMPALVGMIGGLIGGVGTLLGIVIVNVSMRRVETLPIATAAVVVGAILQAVFRYGKAGAFLLFVCWQSAVAATIAHGLSIATAESE
jgi:hypothetical protein